MKVSAVKTTDEIKTKGDRKRRLNEATAESQRLLKSSFRLLQSICGALLLERFW